MIPPLVHTGESVHASDSLASASSAVCEKTGSISSSVSHSRSDRYKLQKASKSILRDFDQPNGNRFSVVGCLSSLKKDFKSVSVLKGKTSDVCHFGGLQRCGSVWTCPVCAAAVTEKRAQEIVKAQALHREKGLVTLMLTYTHSHKKHTKLSETMDLLPKAMRSFRNSRKYKNLMQSVGYQGLIRSLEVTYSESNGFHVHTHELLFLNSDDVDLSHIKSTLFAAWYDACKKHGLGLPSERRGVTVKTSFSASDYLAKFGSEQKWSTGAELSKSHVKNGRAKSLTMFDFLRLASSSTDIKDKQKYSDLFKEFAFCFFGKRQIFWTRGLKNHFNIDDLTDESILDEKIDEAEIVCEIPLTDWSFMRRLSFDFRPILLDWAEKGGAFAVQNYILMMREIYP